LKRQVTLALPHFQAVALSVASGPYVAAVPVQFANAVRNDLSLHVFQPPLSIPVPDVRLYWHGRQNQDPAHRWMRSEIAAAVEHLGWAAGWLPPSQD
jgi:DNA-binding transcriptional LysR family regulator